jgi:hypothetical protein
MTMLDGASPVTKRQNRQSVANFVDWRFPDLKALEGLRKVQTEEREYLEYIERNGASGRVVEYLRGILDSRETEIKALEAKGRLPR